MQPMTWNIDGVQRDALVSFAPKENSTLLFAFHGHGGTAQGFANKNKFEVLWPQTTVVYPQGLASVSPADSLGSKSGWQHIVGEINNTTHIQDQDLKFFDKMLDSMINEFTCNPSFVFIHGWSNGGEFVYDVLWTARGNKIAAIAGASSVLNTINNKNPLPALHIAGKDDPVVSFAAQEKSIQSIYKLNQCRAQESAWAIDDNGVIGVHRWSSLDKQTYFLEYDGGHDYPSNVPKWIIKFFRHIEWKAKAQ